MAGIDLHWEDVPIEERLKVFQVYQTWKTFPKDLTFEEVNERWTGSAWPTIRWTFGTPE